MCGRRYLPPEGEGPHSLRCPLVQHLWKPCGPAMLCEAGLCVQKACGSDAACGDAAYCTSDGNCAPLGTCIEICNSGSEGTDYGEFAGCGAGVCENVSSLPSSAPVRLGVCEDG